MRRFRFSPQQRLAWLANMQQALKEVVAEPLAGELLAFFERRSVRFLAQDAGESTRPVETEISHREDIQDAFDEAIAALRGGNAALTIQLAESSRLRACTPSMFCGLLAAMARSGNGLLSEYLIETVTANPSLVQERFNGRTLLHDAAAAGCMSVLHCLLHLEADPNSQDAGGHTPLYSAANECAGEEAGVVIKTLAAAGADVNRSGGVQHCTALHMAARRGNVAAAAALLDCGAAIGSRDSKGATPLQRAINCRKRAAAEFLRARVKSVSDV